MIKIRILVVMSITMICVSCNNSTKERISSNIPVDQSEKEVVAKYKEDIQANTIIAKAIESHGGKRYDTADYTFVFRKNEYHFKNNGKDFTYEVKMHDKDIKDVIVNGNFTRFVNQKPANLSEKRIKTHSQALNSVIYFATLPHKLSDTAVNKSYQGTVKIQEETYDVVKIFFNEEGGGQDHDDNYYYWINTQTHKIDFLAYNYMVNGGGVRFRSFYNRRNVEGIIFQDYINWGAPIGTPLAKLPELFENEELKELSKIKTEQIQKNN